MVQETGQKQSELEDILQSFDNSEGIFAHPLQSSRLNADVTSKYLISMTNLSDNPDEVVGSFCERFGANEQEMQTILTDKREWASYELYTAYAIHCQLHLGVDDQEFFRQITEKVFLDHQDAQIAVSKHFPANVVLAGLKRANKSWNRVTGIEVEQLQYLATSFRISRWTFNEHKERLAAILTPEQLTAVLKRDCDISLASYQATFQKLFSQPNLYIERERSEADPVAESEKAISQFLVHTTNPHNPWYSRALNFVTSLIKNTRRNAPALIRPYREQEQLRDRLLDLEDTIQQRTDQLAEANVHLEKRQELIVDLLTEISRIRSSGGRHGVRNFLQRSYGEERKRIIGYVTNQISQIYEAVKGNSVSINYLENLCKPFDILLEDFADKESISDRLYAIKINSEEDNEGHDDSENLGNSPVEDSEVPLDDSDEEMDDLFADLFGDSQVAEEVILETAFQEMQDYKGRYQLENKDRTGFKKLPSSLVDFNPFVLLYSLRTLKKVMGEVNKQFSGMDQMTMLDNFSFSSVLEEAIYSARDDKKSSIKLLDDVEYDAKFITNRDSVLYMVRDLVYNAIDAGASEVNIATRRPGVNGEPPYLHELGFKDGEYPSFYLCVEDNGEGIPQSKATELMAYLQGKVSSTSGLSTKGKSEDEGALGSKNLKRLIELHNGKVYYEPFSSEDKTGTRVHVYLQRLEI